LQRDTGIQIGNLGLLAADGRQFLDVLGGLFLEDFQRVVLGQHT
jgi:hypothetical protein